MNNFNKFFWVNGPDFILKNGGWWENHQSNEVVPCVEPQISVLAENVEDIITTHKYVNNYETLLRIFSYLLTFVKSYKDQETYQGAIQADKLQQKLLVVCQII